MPIFVYKGYDSRSGAVRKGKVEADSVKAARQMLRVKEKIIPSEIKEELKIAKGKQSKPIFGGGVGLPDLAIMTRQFAVLQSAQVPLDECLKALTDQVEHVVLRNALASVKESVSEGKSLADAMKDFPTIFETLYINMVRAGESSGSLGLVLERLADFLEYQVAVKGKVFSALAYPAIMILASLGIIIYLFVSVVPKLQKVFISLKVELPWYTEALIKFSEILQNQWYLLLGGIGLIYLAYRSWVNTPSGKETMDRFALKVPVFGGVVLRLNVSKFTKTLSTLLGSGVPIIAALEITKNIVENKILSDVIVEAKQSVQEGESFGAVIERSKKFPSLVSHMIKTGEKTGELESMLRHVADAYDAEVERKIDTLISMIEPLMIMFMGGIVVFIVIAMLVPMLGIMSQVR